MNQTELFQTAVTKAKAGERSQARTLLLELVGTQPEHEMAWLWLSELADAPEDKLIALENAFALNPQRPQTQQRLNQLRQQVASPQQPAAANFSANGYGEHHTQEEGEFAHIQQQFTAGNSQPGREQLAAFLHRNANHEAGWWLMVQHADSQKNQLKSLDHLLRLNPEHPEAPAIIATITPTREDFLQMGLLYERLRQWETAVSYYKRALKSPNNADRLLAQKRLPAVTEQVKLANIKVTSPTFTVLRLAAGPTLLYSLLVLIQAGLKPLQVSPMLCFGNLLFGTGLLVLGGLTYTPEHPWLQPLRGTAVSSNEKLTRGLALACVVMPIVLLILRTVTRLLDFWLSQGVS